MLMFSIGREEKSIVSGKGPSLMDQDWLQHIKFDYGEIRTIVSQAVRSLEYRLEKYGTIFQIAWGLLKLRGQVH